MKEKYTSFIQTLNKSLTFKSRILVFVAALILIPSLFLPLWHLDFSSQQYPEGLKMFIYSNKMVGGNDGNDLTEINVLNHYIGMKELKEQDFTEFKWIPLAVSIVIVLTLRAAVIGAIKSLVDILVSLVYFGGFSLWRFWYMLHSYGHNLDPHAAVKVEPFTPPIFGNNLVGQFTVKSFPSSGSYLFILFALLIVVGFYFSMKQKKSPN